MKAYWNCAQINNFGDVLPCYLMPRLFGLHLEWSNTDDEQLFMFAGSAMAEVKPNVICSCLGFGAADQVVTHTPAKIVSVRGKITRDMMLAQGHDCPDNYFDFVQLLPNIFKYHSEGRRLYVPHYVDKGIDLDSYETIDICAGVESVMTDLMQAGRVITSSLHIMMVCELYGIPYNFAYPVNEIAGDGCKYFDFFTTLNKKFKPVSL